MWLIARLVASLGVVILVGCGQVDPVLMPVSVPECIYGGPSAMEEGNARVSLNLNGIGDAGVVLVELASERTYADLERHFTNDGRWAGRPTWISGLLELRLDSSQGLDGLEETVELTAGNHAIVCLDYSGDEAMARPAGRLVVEKG